MNRTKVLKCFCIVTVVHKHRYTATNILRMYSQVARWIRSPLIEKCIPLNCMFKPFWAQNKNTRAHPLIYSFMRAQKLLPRLNSSRAREAHRDASQPPRFMRRIVAHKISIFHASILLYSMCTWARIARGACDIIYLHNLI